MFYSNHVRRSVLLLEVNLILVIRVRKLCSFPFTCSNNCKKYKDVIVINIPIDRRQNSSNEYSGILHGQTPYQKLNLLHLIAMPDFFGTL